METVLVKSDKKKTLEFRRVLVWELPVRVFHWANALCITVLIISGLIIANPPAIMSRAEATEIYWFGTLRTIHFTAAYLFVAIMILRLYWAFAGNRFASWKSFIPFGKKAWHNIKHVLKIDILLRNEKEPEIKNLSIGHNYVAAASYIIMFLLALVQVFSGFGLYAPTSEFWFADLFAWVPALFGGDEITLRLIHHVTTWLFIFFIIVHVYLVFYHDWLEGRGESSAMISGYKFVRSDRLNEDQKDD